MTNLLKNKMFQLCIGVALGIIVMSLPRPQGTLFLIKGDGAGIVATKVSDSFRELPPAKEVGSKSKKPAGYLLEVKDPARVQSPETILNEAINAGGTAKVTYDNMNGLSAKSMRFLGVLVMLVFLFVSEAIPLEITAILIGVLLTLIGVADVKEAWAPYMNPVVVFIMCCLIFAICLDKTGLTKRLGCFIMKKAGNGVVSFTFVISIGLGIASGVMHDAAATAIGLGTMIPLMRAAGIKPYSNTGKFMVLSLPFACSCGGMGTLVGGGRCMVSAAFLKEFTGMELSFLDWMLYAFPAALITVPAAVAVIYFVFRPDRSIRLPNVQENAGPLTEDEKKALIVFVLVFVSWLTSGLHGLHYSVTGMIGVAALVVMGVLKWEDIHANLEWGTALFIFGGGLSLGLAMDSSGTARYFAGLFMPYIKGGGWLLLFVGVGVFGALVTNVMANVAAAALIMPIVIPMAQAQGVDPRIIALCLGMATSFAMLLVIGCPPNALAYSYRYFRASDLTKAGLVATPILLCILVVVAAVWWKILGLV